MSGPEIERISTQPVGVLLIAVLHLRTDADDPTGAVACPPGSYLAISHLTSAATR